MGARAGTHGPPRMAGYSGTPLAKKLGIRAGTRVTLLGAPKDFQHALGRLPEGAAVRSGLRGRGAFDVALLFAERRAELERRLPALIERMDPDGGLWIAWPKQSAVRALGLATDLTGDVVRAVGLATGLVDNKVCAVDDTWSGLRFVVRIADRPRRTRR